MPDFAKNLNRKNNNPGHIHSSDFSMFQPMKYNITNQDGGNTSVIDIDGFIGTDIFYEWMTGEKSPNTVNSLKDQLRSISAKKIIVNINSPGGDFNDGLVIKNLLESKNAEVVTNLYGLSASAATAIHQGGTKRRMAKNTSFMLIHRVMYGLLGYYNQNSLKSFVDDQETMDRNIISMYTDKSGAAEQEITELMDAGEGYGKWIDADTALKMGLIDEIFEPEDTDDPDTDHMDGDDDNDNDLENSLRRRMNHAERITMFYNTQNPEATNKQPDDDLPGEDQTDQSVQSDASASRSMRERELQIRQLKQKGISYA